jgi:hypothetical protein
MDREMERIFEEMTAELKEQTRVLKSSIKTTVKHTKNTEQESKAKARLVNTIGDLIKSKDKLGDLSKDLAAEFDDLKKSAKNSKKSFLGIPGPIQLVKKGLNILKDAVIGTGVAMAKTALALSDTTKSIANIEDLVDEGFGELGLVGKGLKGFAREIDSNVESFTQLAKMGATFGSSIVQLRAAQADALMPLSKFTDLIGANSNLLAKLFGTVDQGVPQIAGLTRRLRDITEDEFAKFGLTLDDTSGFLTTFLELERARGNTQRMSQAQLLAGTQEYTKNLVILSKLTGESVDKLNEQNMAMAADGVFQSQLTKMNADDAKLLSASIGNLPGPLQQFAKEMIGLGAPISDTSRELQAISGGRLGDAILAFQRDLDPVAFQNAMKTISGDVMQNSEAFGQAALAGGGFGEALNAIVTQIGEAIDPDILDDEIKARGDNIANLRNLTSEVDRLKSAVETTRFNFLQPFLYQGELTVEVTKGINDKMKQLAEEGLPAFEQGVYSVLGALGVDVPANLKKPGSSKNTDVPSSFWQRFGNIFGGAEGGAGSLSAETYLPDDYFSSATNLPAQAGSSIMATATDTGATTNTTTITNNQTVKQNQDELLAEMKKQVAALNTLVTIGAMTEKNTKNMNNNVANMGGSLV